MTPGATRVAGYWNNELEVRWFPTLDFQLIGNDKDMPYRTNKKDAKELAVILKAEMIAKHPNDEVTE